MESPTGQQPSTNELASDFDENPFDSEEEEVGIENITATKDLMLATSISGIEIQAIAHQYLGIKPPRPRPKLSDNGINAAYRGITLQEEVALQNIMKAFIIEIVAESRCILDEEAARNPNTNVRQIAPKHLLEANRRFYQTQRKRRLTDRLHNDSKPSEKTVEVAKQFVGEKSETRVRNGLSVFTSTGEMYKPQTKRLRL
eukprot:Platyproteum_vivax@DN12944_c0_g1_i1.p1